MGQKVNPHGLRVGIIKDWDSKWYADTKDGEFADNLVEDYKIREYVKTTYFKEKNAKDRNAKDINPSISKVEIERTADKVKVTVYTAKPGIIIGKGGSGIEDLKKKVQKLTSKKLFIEVLEIKKPDTDAQLIAENIAEQLEARIPFRRAMKSSMGRAMKGGVLGIKAAVSGRLGGADMARTEFYNEGTIPLQTLRADIDYGFAEADTTYGKVGVKTWVYHGEILPTKGNNEGSDK